AGHPEQFRTCPSRRGSREVVKLVARTDLPRSELHSVPIWCAIELVRTFRLPRVLGQHGRLNKSSDLSVQLNGIEPSLRPFSGWSHHFCWTPIAFQNGKAEYSDSSFVTERNGHICECPHLAVRFCGQPQFNRNGIRLHFYLLF